MGWFSRNGSPYNSDWDRDRELKRQKWLKQQQRFWSKWITATGLRRDRNWTNSSIKKFLKTPKDRNGYKVYSLTEVRKAEQTENFKTWMQKRRTKQAEKTNKEQQQC